MADPVQVAIKQEAATQRQNELLESLDDRLSRIEAKLSIGPADIKATANAKAAKLKARADAEAAKVDQDQQPDSESSESSRSAMAALQKPKAKPGRPTTQLPMNPNPDHNS